MVGSAHPVDILYQGGPIGSAVARPQLAAVHVVLTFEEHLSAERDSPAEARALAYTGPSRPRCRRYARYPPDRRRRRPERTARCRRRRVDWETTSRRRE